MQERKKKLNKKNKHHIHYSYSMRLFLSLSIFAISFGLCLYFATKSFEYRDERYINYSEKNAIDYKVYVKENDFYDTDYLEKGMIYVSGLIDKIIINFDYLFDIDEKTDMNFKYQVMADLVIANASNTAMYFEKNYTLLDTQEKQIIQDTKNEIKEEIVVDYDYYNQLAVNYKQAYGLETTSYIKVYLKIEKDNDKLNINDPIESAITIPLSERSVQIKFDAQDTQNFNKVVADKELIFKSNNFIIEIILFFISVFTISKVVKLMVMLIKEKSKYDKHINKILKEYDRLIVETTTGIDYKNSNIIKINKFNELLDVRDNLRLPIMYYVVVKHQKCNLYIKHNNDVYVYQVKASEMENKDEN